MVPKYWMIFRLLVALNILLKSGGDGGLVRFVPAEDSGFFDQAIVKSELHRRRNSTFR